MNRELLPSHDMQEARKTHAQDMQDAKVPSLIEVRG